MIVLGIHAGHNASAALMINGEIVGMIQEERFTKRKNQSGFPRRAIETLVSEHLGGDFHRIDRLGYGSLFDSIMWTALDHYAEYSPLDFVQEMHDYWYPFFYGDKKKTEEENWADDYWINRYRSGENLNKDHNFDLSFMDTMSGQEAFDHFNYVERKEVLNRLFGWTGPVEFVEHHSCHAAWAFWGSDLTDAQRNEALVLTADSRGDNSNWSVSVLDEAGDLDRIAGGLDNHVARIYKYTTLILGMKPNEHEYKVMGLAPYSQSRRHVEAVERVFFEALDFRDGGFVRDKPLVDSYFDLKRRLEGHRFDNIAAGLQNWCTGVTRSWAQHWLRETGKKGLCFSGGLSMNIRTNGHLLESDGVDWISVPASGGDESLSAGACYRLSETKQFKPLRHVYLGEEPSGDRDGWFSALDNPDEEREQFGVLDDVDTAAAAKMLAGDLILARCVGRAEFGSRALGNRSIIANPSNMQNLQTINSAIKHRDFWMPFSPSVLSEHASTVFRNEKGVTSPYMTIGYDTYEEWHAKAAAAVHPSDRSGRPQFVSEDTNPEYWALIDAFRELTGIPVLLNTSLNLHGDPMNYSVADAVRTLAHSELDYLLIPGNRLIYKKTAYDRLASVLEKVSA